MDVEGKRMAKDGAKMVKNRNTLVAVLLLGAFVAVFNQTIMLTATPHLMDEFSLTENSAQWVTTIFMLINGIMIPLSAFLMESFTSRKLYMFSIMTFIAGTIVCAISFNFPMLMIGRIIQAIGAGIIFPLMMTIFMLVFPVERRGFAMGISGLVISFAPALAPALSGWMIEFLPWRSVFYVIIPIAIIDLLAAYFFMRNIIELTHPKVDVLSIVLSIFGFGGLLYGFSSAGNYGWTNVYVYSSILVGSVSLVWFILRQFKLRQPILEFRVFQYNVFSITIVIGMIAFSTLIATETILPIYMQVMAGFNALEAGLVILPGALLSGFLSPLVGKIFDAIGARWLLIIGLFVMTATTLFFTNLTAETSLFFLIVAFAARMVGLSMVAMPATTAGLNVLPNRLIPHGTAMMNTMRQVAASIGTGLFITIMTTAAKDEKVHGIEGLIHGVNVSFYAMTILTALAFLLSFFVEKKRKSAVST